MTGDPMPPPEDPFPDLTLVDLAELRLAPEYRHLQAVRCLFPDTPMVFAAEVIERRADGSPWFVRLLP